MSLACNNIGILHQSMTPSVSERDITETSKGNSKIPHPPNGEKTSYPSTSNQPSQNIYPADEIDVTNSQVSLPDLQNIGSPKEQRLRNKSKKRKQQSSPSSSRNDRNETLDDQDNQEMCVEEKSQNEAHGGVKQKPKKIVAEIHHHRSPLKQQTKEKSKLKPDLIRKHSKKHK